MRLTALVVLVTAAIAMTGCDEAERDPCPGGTATAAAHTTEGNVERIRLAGCGFEVERPTALAFGPDGRLYVAGQEGRIQALTVGAEKQIVAIEDVTSDADLQEVFGLAFYPPDRTSPPALYVSNTVSGIGDEHTAPEQTYPGRITRISGDGYDDREDIITGLPISNSSHQTESLMFTEDGTLYILQGSTTNAGVENPPGSFFFRHAEVPLSGAVLVARPFEPGFDGDMRYSTDGYSTETDIVSGDVVVYASGLRNAYDGVLHSNGRMYVTDNGMDTGTTADPSGPASLSCDTDSGKSEAAPDELNVIEPGSYYGHPNRNRGRSDPRQCVYHPADEPGSADYTAPAHILPSSSNGIAEYPVTNGAAAQGDLVYASLLIGEVRRLQLSPDGTDVVLETTIASGFTQPLDVAVQADGTLFIAEYGGNAITVLRPRT